MAEQIDKTYTNELSIKDFILKTKDIWQFLWNKWLIILLAGLLGGIIGLTVAFLSKPKYTGKLSFVVENDRTNPLGAYSTVASMAGIDLGGGSGTLFNSDNLIELMKSRRIIEGALLTTVEIDGAKTTLLQHYINFNGIQEDWAEKPELAKIHFPAGCDPEKFSRNEDSIVGTVYDDLVKNVVRVSKPDKKLSMIISTCTTTDEVFSKRFLEEMTKKVTEFYIETKTKRLKQNVNILQNRADSLAIILTSSTIGIANLTDQNLNPSRAIVMASRSRKQVDLQVAGATYGEVIKNLELAKVTLQRETPLIQIIDSPIYPLEKEKLGKAKGILIGGILGGLLIVLWLFGKRYYHEQMDEDILE